MTSDVGGKPPCFIVVFVFLFLLQRLTEGKWVKKNKNKRTRVSLLGNERLRETIEHLRMIRLMIIMDACQLSVPIVLSHVLFSSIPSKGKSVPILLAGASKDLTVSTFLSVLIPIRVP